jgi:hypothetical protein
MKKTIAVVSLVFFVIAVFAFAADDAKEELRPSQKVMRARQAWLTAISENLGAKNFEAVAKDADQLAAQTKKVGENLPNPLAKELTLAISLLANNISAAANKKDGETISAKLGEIKGKCGECHAKIRDKK